MTLIEANLIEEYIARFCVKKNSEGALTYEREVKHSIEALQATKDIFFILNNANIEIKDRDDERIDIDSIEWELENRSFEYVYNLTISKYLFERKNLDKPPINIVLFGFIMSLYFPLAVLSKCLFKRALFPSFLEYLVTKKSDEVEILACSTYWVLYAFILGYCI